MILPLVACFEGCNGDCSRWCEVFDALAGLSIALGLAWTWHAELVEGVLLFCLAASVVDQ